MGELAGQLVMSRVTVPGVQPKMSLDLEPIKKPNEPRRFTIVGLWGRYILKPPSPDYPQLPEVEDCTMHLAELARIKTVPHTLIRMQDGQLAYLTKRVDRTQAAKLHMEDMCQLTERLTEHKYAGSHEQIAKVLLKHSANPGLDVVNFYEQVLFSFITGNSDMHLKNFSMLNDPITGYTLSPAYDLVAVKLVNPTDDEELALTLNGKKKRITWDDFEAAFTQAGIPPNVGTAMLTKFRNALPTWKKLVAVSFLREELRKELVELIESRLESLR
jgi:serine/threonine-protein kinase HipA